MPQFEFVATDSQGQEIKDTIEATDERDAQQQIRELGYFVTNLRQVGLYGSTVRRCPSCDHTNPADSERCEQCGNWLSESDEVQPKIDVDPDTLDGRILSMVQGGNKIGAIKLYRAETSAGLKEAPNSAISRASPRSRAGAAHLR